MRATLVVAFDPRPHDSFRVQPVAEFVQVHGLKGYARLHLDATIEDFNFKAPRGLDRSVVLRLASGQWIRDGQTVFVSGATGSGKSYLACALGHQAYRIGISTRYYRVSRLLDELTLARADGSYPKLIERLARTWLLILDDWGSLPSRARDYTISWRCSTTAMPAAGRCSPARSPSSTGTTSSEIPPSATPSWTAFSITRTVSSSGRIDVQAVRLDEDRLHLLNFSL